MRRRLGRRAEVKGGMTPLLYAARDGRLEPARLLVAAALMGGFLYFGIRWFADALASASPLYTQAITLAALSAAAAIIYFAVSFAIGGADFGMLRRSVRRGAARADTQPPPSD